MTHGWSKPYYGVQHLVTAPGCYQLTVTEFATGAAEAYVLHLRSEHPFTSVAETTCASAAEARAWAESRPEAKGSWSVGRSGTG